MLVPLPWRLRRFVHRAFLIVTLLGLAACGSRRAPPAAVDGAVDLRTFSFDDSSVLTLQGQWQVFWERFIGPGESPPPDGTLPIGRWNGQRLFDGRELPGQGHASYRLRVQLPATPQTMSLVLLPIIDAAELVISRPDGALVAEPLHTGHVGTTRETSSGRVGIQEVSFLASGELWLTLHVSNFEHARGGFGAAPLFGTTRAMRKRDQRRRMIDFFVLGLLCVVGLQHLGQFAFSRRESASFCFGVLCFVIALRLFILGRYPAEVMPELSSASSLFLEYVTAYLPIILVSMFLRTLFPRFANRRILNGFIVLGVIFLATLVLPRHLYSRVMPVYQLVTTVGVAYSLVVVLRAVWVDRDLPPVLMLAGFLVLGVMIVIDILRVSSVVVSATTTTHWGLAGFVVFQSAMLAVLNQRRNRELEQRNRDVQLLNVELRQQIASRSHELSKSLARIATARAPSALEPGTVVADKYRVERLLGEGGMGKVYRALRLTDSRPVALKLVRAGDPTILARFAREAELVARVTHPNVVAILDFGITAEAALFLVMELVEGPTLEEQRTRFGERDWALPLVRQLATALVAIHQSGVIHRDVKPSNLMLTRDSVLKLTDFGIAQVAREPGVEPSEQVTVPNRFRRDEAASDPQAETADVMLTRTGMLVGSPLYMAPELARGAEHATARSDWFSFGLVAYELLTGKRAYVRSLVVGVRDGDPPPDPPPRLASLLPDLLGPLASTIDACLDLVPDARPDARAIARVLAA
jgi:hypothetical protein